MPIDRSFGAPGVLGLSVRRSGLRAWLICGILGMRGGRGVIVMGYARPAGCRVVGLAPLVDNRAGRPRLLYHSEARAGRASRWAKMDTRSSISSGLYASTWRRRNVW